MGMFNGVLFYPDKEHYDISKLRSQIEQKYHLKVEDVTINASDGTKLHGYFCRLPGAKKVMLYSHGNGGNIDYRLSCAFYLLGVGTSVLLYDYEGYGKSEGSPTLTKVCDDAVCAYDYLQKNEHYQPKEIVLYGESLGSGVSCELLKKRECGGIILMSGFASLLGTGKDLVPLFRIYPDFAFPEPQMNNLATLSGKHPPLLILHGEKDQVLKHSYSETLARDASPPKTFVTVPDGDHTSVVFTDLFKNAATQFLAGLH
jgi:pimeloyl-ACP methyl ester carboxylesterase